MAGDDRKHILREAAIDRAEDLFLRLVGPPNNPRSRTWRHGNHDSFSMAMRGPDRGLWYDHEGKQGGDLLDLVAIRDMGLPNAKGKADFPAVLKRIEALLGMPDLDAYDSAELDRRRKAREAAQKAEDQETAEVVRAVQNAAQPLAGSPAEAYMRRRGITRMPPGWSFAPPLKPRKRLMHPHHAALVAWALDDSGTVKGGARVLVMPDGSKAPEDARKPTFGNIGGFPARLPADTADGPLFVAEGPETALTVWQATGCETWATYGASNFESAPVPTGRTVIFCPDADAPDSPAGQSFLRACRHHVARGVNLYIAQPGQKPGSKQDLNDTLRERGEDAVKALLEAAQPFRDPDALPTVTEAREALSGAVGAFYTAVGEWHGRDPWAKLADTAADKRPPLHLLTAGLGLGKTRTTAQAMVARLRHLRAKGDDTSSAVFLVPMHRLGEEIAGDLRQMAPELRVAVIRGAEAQDPQKPSETACKRLDDYRHRQRHLLDPCSGCPLKDSCIVEHGRNVVADIYVQAHPALAAGPAPCSDKRTQRLDHAVIDESPMGALLLGVDAPRQLALAAWRAARLPGDPGEAADLDAYRARLLRAAEAVKDGPLSRTALLAEGLTAEQAGVAAKLEWRRKVEDESSPELGQNLTVARAAGIFKAVAHLLAGEAETGGRLHVVTDPESGLGIRHRGLREISGGWNVPMLALDATADEAVTAALLQRPIARSDDIRAAEPMLTIRQDPSFSGAKSMLIDSPSEKGKKACANNRRALETYINRQARKIAPAMLLVVGNKALLELLDLEKNAHTAHFNALRGLNSFAAAKAAIIIGRPQPDERTLAAMTGALFGREVEGRITPKGTAWRRTVGGMDVAGKAATHDDPDAQRLLHLIRDAEVMQAIGRLRAVNRTEPVEVMLLSDAVLPVPVVLVDAWRGAVKKADPIADMLEDGGVAFLSPAHAAKAYPERWKTKQAAQRVWGGVTGQQSSLSSLYDESCPVVVSYRLPRARESSIAVLDARRHPVPEASLRRILGPLAAFEVLSEPKMEPDTAINATVKRLESIAKAVGHRPPIEVREVEASVFVAGQISSRVWAEGLRRRGWPVEAVP
jgi:hypothetical protein